jgi:hypothetical protein
MNGKSRWDPQEAGNCYVVHKVKGLLGIRQPADSIDILNNSRGHEKGAAPCRVPLPSITMQRNNERLATRDGRKTLIGHSITQRHFLQGGWQ